MIRCLDLHRLIARLVASLLIGMPLMAMPASAPPWVRVMPISATASAAAVDTPPSAAIDGKPSTWWSGNELGASLTLDLGAARYVKQVRIAFHLGGVRAYNFEIQSSTDGQGYTSAGYFQSSGTSAAFETFSVTAPGRYLRIVGSGNTFDRSNAYKEVQVLAEATLVRIRPVSVAASQSASPGWAAAALDDDLNSYWLGESAGANLTFDWGTTQQVKQVRIAFYNGNARLYGLQIQASTDGETFTSAGTFQSSGTTSLLESFTVDAPGRYLRIVGWGNNVNRHNAYYEVQAYAIQRPAALR
ncbi:MAG: discoidin domain-containing protein [Pseudomonadota bacterium]|nr:discoidin domain-containing protein [Pseudomonadota bacterium]